MPWEHCGQDVRDDDRCPACGVDKQSWTVEFDVTRQFKVSRRPALAISLVRGDDEPVGGEPYRVELPDGAVVDGQLDELGCARVASATRGTCVLTFPERLAGEVVRATEGDDRASPPPEDDHPARFECALDRRQQFRLASAKRLKVVDGRGNPIVGVEVKLAKDGRERSRSTTREGYVSLVGVTEGTTLTLADGRRVRIMRRPRAPDEDDGSGAAEPAQDEDVVFYKNGMFDEADDDWEQTLARALEDEPFDGAE